MTWEIKYLASARKDFGKIDPRHRRRIREYLEKRIAALDNPRQFGKPLKGRLADYWRYRIGPYRVICQLRDQQMVVLVVRAGHRKAVYR